MNLDALILKQILLEQDEEPETDQEPKKELSPFEEDPMGFILKKYASLNELLTELMTDSFQEYLNAIFIVAPKPTTFKILLHNGQYFFLTYLDKAYQATISGKNYYLMTVGEKQLCMQAIARLLRFGSPLKTKGPEGAEQGTEGAEEAGGGEEATAPETPPAEGGEETLTEAAILSEMLKTFTLEEDSTLEISESTASANREAVKALVSKYPDKFEPQSAINRIANKTKMSAKDFQNIIKSELKAKNIKIYSPKQGPNTSSKFDMFEFDTEFGRAQLYLSGGASANLGSKFEKDLVNRIKSVEGLSKSEIEDKPIVKILDALKIDPRNLKADNVIAAGEVDTKRPLSLKGPQNRGQKISDIIIKYKNKEYYLSIKNVSGSGIYNGGVIPGIVFNKDKTKIVFNKDAFDSNETIKKILDLFDIDIKKIVSGLNNYINGTGKETSFEETKGNIKAISKLLGSAIDYGYYYIREIPGGDIKIYNIDSPEKTMEILGTPTGTFVKYPSKSTKIATLRVPLENSLLGLKRADVSIRNATGGIDKPVIKINLF